MSKTATLVNLLVKILKPFVANENGEWRTRFRFCTFYLRHDTEHDPTEKEFHATDISPPHNAIIILVPLITYSTASLLREDHIYYAISSLTHDSAGERIPHDKYIIGVQYRRERKLRRIFILQFQAQKASDYRSVAGPLYKFKASSRRKRLVSVPGDESVIVLAKLFIIACRRAA